jgi:hypothetical protein|tara:strand:- start:781 stop:1446 length:666 start_codon:yes stop_codon:yes gene_type:complete
MSDKQLTTPASLPGYEKLWSMVDTNPELPGDHQPKGGDTLRMNRDFAVIKGSIETTRDFALKAMMCFQMTYQITDKQFIEAKSDLHISITVDVGGVQATGGCSLSEVRQGKDKAFHFAQARAETRAMKRAIEAKIGLPIVNQIILNQFGGYDWQDEPERSVKHGDEWTETGKRFKGELDSWVEGGKMTEKASKMWLERARNTPDIESLNRVISEARKAARV